MIYKEKGEIGERRWNKIKEKEIKKQEIIWIIENKAVILHSQNGKPWEIRGGRWSHSSVG
ncbi:MAG: hypothetical protein K2K58_04305 [Muribaculaceae bacterium]|nr:hypothetical protein [Muribaculaceae bacterium]